MNNTKSKVGYKNFVKYFFIILLSYVLFSSIYRIYNYQTSILGSYTIEETIIVNIKGSSDPYILNLEKQSIERYNNSISDIIPINDTFENPYRKYIYIKGNILYNDTNKILNFYNSYYPKYWTLNGKYLVNIDLLYRHYFYGLFKKRFSNLSVNIVDLDNGKNTQFLLKDDKGNFLEISKIVGIIKN